MSKDSSKSTTSQFMFDIIFAPLTAAEFIDHILNQSPFYIPGHQTKFSELFSEEEFWDFLPLANSIRAVMPHLKQATIRHNDARDMFESGATLCVSGLEGAVKKLAELANGVCNEIGFAGPIEIKAYMSPARAGFDAHYDPRTVTTLQIAGSKRWCYGNAPAVNYPPGNSPYPLSTYLEQSVAISGASAVVLKPGDVLCLPPGTIHWATASDFSLALNFSFEYVGASIADHFCESLLMYLKQNPTMRRNLIKNVISHKKLDQFNEELIGTLFKEVRHAMLQIEQRMKADSK